MWTLTAPKLLSYLVTTSGTKTQKQKQERNSCSNHFSFLFLRLPRSQLGKIHRGLMLDVPRCWFYVMAAWEGLCAQISRSCLMSYVLNTLLMGAPRSSLSRRRHAGDNLV